MQGKSEANKSKSRHRRQKAGNLHFLIETIKTRNNLMFRHNFELHNANKYKKRQTRLVRFFCSP